MDWSFLQPIALSVASFAITAGVAVGSAMITKYTGITVSAANEQAIRNAANTEAGKMIALGNPVTPLNVGPAAAKVINDLPKEVKAEGYTHSDVADMIIGAAAIPFPAIGIAAPILKGIAGQFAK